MNSIIQTTINEIDSITTNDEFETFFIRISSAYESSIDIAYKKENGCYYTDFKLAKNIVSKVLTANGINKSNITNKKMLEPCVGLGSFVFSFLDCVKQYHLSKKQCLQIINNLYVSDIDDDALCIYKMLFTKYVQINFNFILPSDYFIGRLGQGLLFDLSSAKIKYIDIKNVFPSVTMGFDIVITNPPYKNFKTESSSYLSDIQHAITKKKYQLIKNQIASICPLSNQGVLNFYRLFVEEILNNYCAPNAAIGLLIPSSFLTDKTCENLRTNFLLNHTILSVDIISENNPYLYAKQAVCVIVGNSSPKTDDIMICSDYLNHKESTFRISLKDIISQNNGNGIVAFSETEYLVIKKLQTYPKIKNCNFIENLRGELDLTTHKEYIGLSTTNYPLLRGRNIAYYDMIINKPQEYVSNKFVEQCTKKRYINRERLICQQVVNLQKEQRVTFVKISKGYVLGNSCNFIAINENEYGVDIDFLLGLLNSKIINWFFKLYSTNNHVNNYEIDNFPIPLESPYKADISQYVREYMQTRNKDLLDKIDMLVNQSFNTNTLSNSNHSDITSTELFTCFCRDMRCFLPEISNYDCSRLLNEDGIQQFIVAQYNGYFINPIEKTINKDTVVSNIIKKYKKLINHEVLNHTSFKLSSLDLEIAKPIPQGGNWKDIPLETAQKSQRIMRIRHTGGRTTLYGRIDYSKPSYTITTYFNRPGNGTYIHPTLDRVLSVREAARLQSFSDSYYFVGNKTNLLNQVGNAVPSLMACAIATSIKNSVGINTCIDLFCGAGGLSLGLHMAGIEPKLGIDHDKSACLTYKVNSPSTAVLCDDITKEQVKQDIINFAIANKIDMICSGPPCQGFSLAGKRFVDDPRNQLFKHYIDIAKSINPKVILFENVEGLLSFQKGAIYKDILDLFSSLGYNSEGRVLLASEYGVPQRRKRVIIICVRKDLKINPKDLFPIPNKNLQVTAREAISDLEKIPCSDNAIYFDNANDSQYVSRLKHLW